MYRVTVFLSSFIGSSADKKEGLRNKIKEYMSRAEELQMKIEEQKEGTSVLSMQSFQMVSCCVAFCLILCYCTSETFTP